MENDVFVDIKSNKPFQHRCSYTVYKELNTDERAARFDKELLEIPIKIYTGIPRGDIILSR